MPVRLLVRFKQPSEFDRLHRILNQVKKIKKAAAIFGVAVLIWLLLRDRTVLLNVIATVVVKVAALAIILSLAAFLAWLIGPQTLYRRYIAGYIRLRRIRQSQHVRQLREAAARNTDQ